MKSRAGRMAVALSISLAVGTAGLLVAPAPTAAAAPVTSSTTQKINAYSWDGYRVVIRPVGSLPAGTVRVSAAISVKKGARTVASNRSAYSASPGTYVVTSAIRYRSRTAVLAYRTSTDSATADYCDIATSDIVADRTTSYSPGSYSGEIDVAYSGLCFGSVYDADYTLHEGTFSAGWTATEYIAGALQPDHAVGERVDYPLDATLTAVTGTITWRTAYWAYRYGPVRSSTSRRTVRVVKVVNTSVMTRTEWNVLGNGDSLAWVRKVIGSRGTLFYDDGDSFLGSAYKWKNSSGSFTAIWFLNGRATNFYWYG